MRTLVLGGIRSGKSQWAESEIAEAVGPDRPVQYVATGAPDSSDPSWSDRIAAHRAARADYWSTVETTDVATTLRSTPGTPTLVDDVGGWLAAVLDRYDWSYDEREAIAAEVDDLVGAVGGFGSPLTIVSPEVGLTVVPATEAGRIFADELGALNQRLAEACDRVVLVVAGQAVRIKGFSA